MNEADYIFNKIFFQILYLHIQCKKCFIVFYSNYTLIPSFWNSLQSRWIIHIYIYRVGKANEAQPFNLKFYFQGFKLLVIHFKLLKWQNWVTDNRIYLILRKTMFLHSLMEFMLTFSNEQGANSSENHVIYIMKENIIVERKHHKSVREKK